MSSSCAPVTLLHVVFPDVFMFVIKASKVGLVDFEKYKNLATSAVNFQEDFKTVTHIYDFVVYG